MLFTSYEFILFLGLFFSAYFLFPKKWQWKVLLAFSLIFYLSFDVRFMIFLVGATGVAYLCARIMDKDKQHKKPIIAVGLILLFGMLFGLKYLNFAIYNVNGIVHLWAPEKGFGYVKWILPLGISFYTFQAAGYLVDCYRGVCEPEKNIAKMFLFLSFFPQMVQGPISRFSQLEHQLCSEHSFDANQFRRGLERIAWGFFKKLVIADRIITAVSAITGNPEQYQGMYVFIGALLYAVELYADFTGGIDIAIGISECIGIEMIENFRRPYFSTSIKEYWRRWHISLGDWLQDYVFYPLSVSKGMLKLNRFCKKHLGKKIGKRIPVYLSAATVWLLTGAWHGASWNFILWGFCNFFFIMLSQELDPLYRRFHKACPWYEKLPYKCFRIVRTVLLMSFIRTLDCYATVPETVAAVASVFRVWNPQILFDGSLLNLGLSCSDYIVAAVAGLIVLTVSLIQRKGSVRDRIHALPYACRVALWCALFVGIMIFGAYGIGFDGKQFIYNQY